MDHGQVQRPEILVEWEIGQIIIDIEEESILEVLWWFGIGNPVEFVCTSQN